MASTAFSVSNWQTTRPREAPTAVRIAISCVREDARTSIRAAILTQAMSSTTATATSSTWLAVR